MKKKILSLLLSGFCIVSSLYLPALQVSAEEAGTVTDTITIDSEELDEQPKEEQCSVSADIGSSFIVTIPKNIILSGTDGQGNYEVTAKGDISAIETVNVVPDDSFYLSSSGKEDIETTVTQEQTAFSYADVMKTVEDMLVGTTTTGNILASGLTSGTWKGSFFFNLNMASGIIVQSKLVDMNIIPDKYNTGFVDNGEITTITGAGKVNGVSYKMGGDGVSLYMQNYYSNTTLGEEVTITDTDFTALSKFVISEGSLMDENRTITFENCKFNSVSCKDVKEGFNLIFKNCSFTHYDGSNTTFYNCYFGGSVSDGLNPYQNVSVYDSYFADFSHDSDSGTHTDGVQIYGANGVDATNIHLYNCRFEMPNLNVESTSYINSPLMLQLEYANGDDITFENIIVNGGGCGIYSLSKSDSYTLSNVTFDNISFGNQTGTMLYKSYDTTQTYSNLFITNKIYVSSVWKDDDGKLHIIATNDTAQDRTLTVVTNNGTYDYTISCIPTVDELSTDQTFADLPIDTEIVIDDDASYLICYDGNQTEKNQVRFVTFDDSVSVIHKENTVVVNDGEIILSGQAGNDITFNLYESGKMILFGTGATYDYNSNSLTPWNDYMSQITEIVIEEGITELGSACFKTAKYVKTVSLPTTLTKIGQNTFMGCQGLDEIILPHNLAEISDYGLHTGNFVTVYYIGTEEEFANISIGNYQTITLNAENVIYISE